MKPTRAERQARVAVLRTAHLEGRLAAMCTAILTANEHRGPRPTVPDTTDRLARLAALTFPRSAA